MMSRMRGTAGPATDTTVGADAGTRRRLVRTSAKLAFLAPAVVAALPAGEAAAGTPKRGRVARPVAPPQPGQPVQPGQTNAPATAPALATEATTFFARLHRVGDVPTARPNADFVPLSLGRDPLEAGHLRVENGADGQASGVLVNLRGAAPGATYRVWFVRFDDGDSALLGSLRTDGSGNFGGQVEPPQPPAARPRRGSRVGTFVLVRDRQDQFITGAQL